METRGKTGEHPLVKLYGEAQGRRRRKTGGVAVRKGKGDVGKLTDVGELEIRATEVTPESFLRP